MATQNRPKRPTIDDVARLSGQSTATVSRYINRTTSVSEARASKIQAAIQQLNYIPQSSAQGLARNQTRTIGLLLPSISSTFFTHLLTGVESRLTAEGYTLLMNCNLMIPTASSRRILGEHNTDGMLVFVSTLDENELRRLSTIRFPVVLLYQSPPEGVHIPCVNIDNLSGVRALLGHLIEDHGRRRIVHIKGPENQEDAYWRELGYRISLDSHGIPYDHDLVETGDSNAELAFQAMKRILQRGTHFDAVFASDDESASGAMIALRQAGLRIPEDVAVVGFDDLSMAARLSPALTTVHSPIEQLADLAASLLIKIIAGEAVPPETLLPTHLVIRNSCGCP